MLLLPAGQMDKAWEFLQKAMLLQMLVALDSKVFSHCIQASKV
jgi:hypothetical protein